MLLFKSVAKRTRFFSHPYSRALLYLPSQATAGCRFARGYIGICKPLPPGNSNPIYHSYIISKRLAQAVQMLRVTMPGPAAY